ncbi:small ribosomal subunit protein mS31 [Neopsephotus bourkii]|uniref:small ribosomal subunit protein mS31 n=1 Tax=Neopsephotus bourkii TaxID=309878 RepID=UPI002AA5DC24|nr:small ribosomal subunit protein mS31 [Neopsephotus bourkii]
MVLAEHRQRRAGRNAGVRNARLSSFFQPAAPGRARVGTDRRGGSGAGTMWSRVRGWGGAAGGSCGLAVRLLAGREVVGVARQQRSPCSEIQKLFSTSSVLSTEKDKSTPAKDSTTEEASQSKEDAAETPKKKLLDIIGNMKVEVSYRRKLQQLKAQEMKKQAINELESPDSEGAVLQRTREGIQRGRPLNPELVEAATAVASSLPLDKKQTESELLAQLKRHEETTDKQKKGGIVNLRNVISEMAVKRQSPAQRGVRIASRISLDFDEDGQRMKPGRFSPQSSESRRSLKVGKRLNIFTKASTETQSALKTVSAPTIWDLEFAKEVAAVTAQPPRNGFEEMIQWTKDGLLWEYPVDNEAGMEDDAEFHEHIFLEKHLKDFPKQGPIRHFMELVICGLSKNPHLSVKQKIEHIEWFHKYFEEKKEYLKDI